MVSLAQIIHSVVSVPVVSQPNSGIPILQNSILHYPEDVAFYTRNIVTIKKAGVEIVGGCCGTTPEYIGGVVDAIGGHWTLL